jgi:hypothetical protein
MMLLPEPKADTVARRPTFLIVDDHPMRRAGVAADGEQALAADVAPLAAAGDAAG